MTCLVLFIILKADLILGVVNKTIFRCGIQCVIASYIYASVSIFGEIDVKTWY